jgi:hypothetical protein
MKIKALLICSITFISLFISGCGGGGGGSNGSSSTSEVWATIGNIASSTTISKDAAGTLSSSGDWQLTTPEGYIVSCPFQNGTATVTKTTLTFKGSGVAKATGGSLAANPKFDVSVSGSYLNGQITNGSFTITFSSNGSNGTLPSNLYQNWNAIKQSGGSVTYVAPLGTYFGSFSGGDSGTWQFSINQTGHIEGTITSTGYNKTSEFYGDHQLDGTITLQDGLNSNTIYTGSVNSASGAVSGTWKNANPKIDTSGSFSGSRK